VIQNRKTAGQTWGPSLAKRALLRRVAAAGGAAALVACGTPAPAGGGASPAAAPTLRAGATVAWMTDQGSPNHAEARTKQVAAFRTQHPELTIDYQPTPDFNTKVQTAFASGTPPDLFFTRVADLTNEVSRSLVQPLDEYVKRDKFPLADFYASSYEQYRVGGKLYALPFDAPNRGFFANVQAFEEAGLKPPPSSYKDDTWTWDAFRTTMDGLMRRFGPQGAFAVDTGRELRSWIPWVWNNGGDFFSKDGKEVVLNQPAGVEALQFLQDLIVRYRVAPPQDQRGSTQQNFLAGKLLMYEAGQPDVGVLRRTAQFKFDVVPQPKGRSATRASAGGGSAFAMSAASKVKEETWAFFKHIMSKPMQEIFTNATGAMVGLKSLVESPDFQAAPPAHMSVFVEGATVLRPDPAAVRWTDVNQVLGEELPKLWTGDGKPKDVADTIKTRVDPFLK
jgi:multiple sugar transport system substrate-binding protein